MSSADNAVDAGVNIQNALAVVATTYQNIRKFLSELTATADGEGFTPIVDHFLRWRSDRDCEGWLTWNFILLFQRTEDPAHDHVTQLRQGDIYGVDVFLDTDTVPALYLSRFHFDRPVGTWDKAPRVAHHWRFSNPLRHRKHFRITEGSDGIFTSVPTSQKWKEKYWDLENVVFTRRDLLSVSDRSKVREVVFQSLKNLADL